MQSITITGRRWFQRTYGNTYFTAQALVDGKPAVSLGMEYGYGDHYLDRAADELERAGFLPGREHHANGSSEPIWQYCRDRGIELHYSATDVSRKRDL